MLITRILNTLHEQRLHRLLSFLCAVGYWTKGFWNVQVRYHAPSRSYAFVVNGVCYMSMGPGWAYSFEFLKRQLIDTFCFHYLPKEGDCIVDIGAGLGEEAIVLAQIVKSSGSVFALEANPSTFAGLDYAAQQNKFDSLKPLNLAIYNMNGEVSIEDDAKSYLGNTINKSGGANSLQVKALTFDAFVDRYKIHSVDFLKVNIEGAEQYLIQGMENSISKIKNVCISCHDFRHNHHQHGEFYVTKRKIVDFLMAKGFQISVRDSGSVVVDDYIYAKKGS